MSEKFTLGDREFVAEPPTLGRLRGILNALDDLRGKSAGASIDAAVALVAAAVPDATPEVVLEIRATLDELNEATAVIIRVAGLEQKVGEANPQPVA